jgi:hypothetical protein
MTPAARLLLGACLIFHDSSIIRVLHLSVKPAPSIAVMATLASEDVETSKKVTPDSDGLLILEDKETATSTYPRYFDGNTELDRALASSILPPISPKCRRSTGGNIHQSLLFNVTMDFVSSKERSQWSPRNAPYEEDIFLLEMTMKHPLIAPTGDEEEETTNNSTSKMNSNANNAVNVTIRLGTGGNIYSHYIEDHLGKNHSQRGKETVPPQIHESSPFNDEVWQLVSVNIQKNDLHDGPGHYKYYIHQAGTYLRDPTGGLGTQTQEQQDQNQDGNNDNTTRAFSSPTVAVYCNTTEASCTVLSWGQHAHVPTIHKSNVLYATRYVACDPVKDDGSVVLEVTNGLTVMIDPDDLLTTQGGGQLDNGDALDYFNVLWGEL